MAAPHLDGRILRRATAGDVDVLVGRILTPVTGVDELLDLGLVIDLAGDTRLSVPLDGTDPVGPEVAEYEEHIWRPGDEPSARRPPPVPPS